MKVLFAVNPISGGVDKEPFLRKARALCDFYGISYTVFKTSGADDQAGLLKQIDSFKPDRIASVGGDGTTLFSAITLVGTDIPLGIIPLGSANGMATELSVNLKPMEALKDFLLSDMVRGLDLLKINDRYYAMHIGDVGVNANIVESYENDPKRGMAIYAKYFIEELKNLVPFKATVIANGKTIGSKVLMTAICNARKYGTGVPLNKIGNPMDGKFEIVLLEKVDLNSLVKAGLSRFNEEYMDNQSSRTITTDYAEIKFEEPRLLQLDGEVVGLFKEIKVEIIKGAVGLLTTKNNTYL